jgi:hypothetical protein
MQAIDLSKASEKKKLIAAVALGLVAILFLWWTFVGFGSSSPATAITTPTPKPASGTLPGRRLTSVPPPTTTDPSWIPEEIAFSSAKFEAPEAKRNIFAYWVPPPTPTPVAIVSTPTPTPTPPVLLAALSPSNVYARTADFTLELSGDKFTPELRVYVDNRELQTKYKGPQQMSASVPAALIANAGSRQVLVRTPDGRAYSLQLPLTIQAPPTPNYTYIGILSTRQRAGDLAYLQDRSNKDIVSVQRGDVVSGRFRITSISEKEIVMVDTSLKIPHKIAMTEGEKGATSPLNRPTPRVDSEDDEP